MIEAFSDNDCPVLAFGAIYNAIIEVAETDNFDIVLLRVVRDVVYSADGLSKFASTFSLWCKQLVCIVMKL